MRTLLFIILAVLAFSSCEKNTVVAEGRIAVYQLASHTLVSGKCQVDPASAVLEQQPLFDDREIISYNTGTYMYQLSPAATAKLFGLSMRAALAVTIDKKPVFFFFHMPMTMSSTCTESITMWSDNTVNQMGLKLGYPNAVPGTVVDSRNDAELIAILRAQGKVI